MPLGNGGVGACKLGPPELGCHSYTYPVLASNNIPLIIDQYRLVELLRRPNTAVGEPDHVVEVRALRTFDAAAPHGGDEPSVVMHLEHLDRLRVRRG